MDFMKRLLLLGGGVTDAAVAGPLVCFGYNKWLKKKATPPEEKPNQTEKEYQARASLKLREYQDAQYQVEHRLRLLRKDTTGEI